MTDLSQNTLRLVNLAVDLDQNTDLLQQLKDGSVSKRDLEELGRLRDALEFINLANLNTVKDNNTQVEPADSGPLGNNVGRFQIKRPLGVGGFAKVYLAHDPLLNRNVALKILTNSPLSENASMRFTREAKSAAILNHPNIVPIYETGRIDDQHFIASQFCAGETLKEYLDTHPSGLEPREAATIIQILADAVEHAHLRGIIHRDLKPANILLANPHFAGNKNSSLHPNDDLLSDSSRESMDNSDTFQIQSWHKRLRITDFGLAKQTLESDQLQTIEGEVVGTPAYMSPEQANGQTDVDTRSDIYSLGVLLWQLITGELPLVGKSNIDTILLIRMEDAPSPRKHKPSLAYDLEAICMKCLAREPDKRYTTSFELAADLQRFLNCEPVQARNITSVDRALKWIRRNPIITAALALTTLAMIISIWQYTKATDNYEFAKLESRRALQETERANAEADRAIQESNRANEYLGGVTEIVDDMLDEMANDKGVPKDPAKKRQLNKIIEIQKSLMQEASSNVRVRENTIRAQLRIAKIQSNMNDYVNVPKSVAVAIELAGDPTTWNGPNDRISNEVLVELFTMQLWRIEILPLMGKFDECQKAIDDSEQMLRKFAPKMDPTDVSKLLFKQQYQRGRTNQIAGKHKLALDDFFKADDLFVELSEQMEVYPKRLTSVRRHHLNNIARCLTELDRIDEASQMFEQAVEFIDIQIAKNPDEPMLKSEQCFTLQNWVQLLYKQRKADKCIEVCQRAIEYRTISMLERDHQSKPIVKDLINLIQIRNSLLKYRKRTPEAIEQIDAVKKMVEEHSAAYLFSHLLEALAKIKSELE